MTANACPKGSFAKTIGIVMKVRPGPAVGSKSKAKTEGRIMRPPRMEEKVARKVIQLHPVRRLVSLER